MFALAVSSALPPLRVAALSHHNGAPSTWNASCAGADVWQCNLQLYESAAAQAVAAGADLLLYPEAYGLDPDKILAAASFASTRRCSFGRRSWSCSAPPTWSTRVVVVPVIVVSATAAASAANHRRRTEPPRPQYSASAATSRCRTSAATLTPSAAPLR